MKRREGIVIAVALLALFVVAGCYAGELKVGDAGPGWEKLTGTDDKPHGLDDYKKAKLVVTVFTCNTCPVAKAYEDRLIALTNDYREKGVQVVAICVNDVDGDRLPAMKKRAAEKKFNFPYVYDESQKVARDYGATCTPHVFVLDGKHNIVYMGAIDDNNNPEKAKAHYLRDAVDALLAGKTPSKTVTQQRGCSIKWKKE